ncbi:hypothetical protein JHK85_000055 [Glycine max]|nr:hypothetical protein JHK85_000055 [Glycine max]
MYRVQTNHRQIPMSSLLASLRLYNELLGLGFKIFILTGKKEHQRGFTEKNLQPVGYTKWERLILGFEIFNETSFDNWVDLAAAPALPASLSLYNELKELGFKIFLLTGRSEFQRNATGANLLRSSDQGKPATTYNSEKRAELENEGYRIHGNSGDQWSDLGGYAVAARSFKLPNPTDYIP